MGIFVLKDVTHWVDQYDLSADFRSAQFNVRRDALDKTVWGNTTRVNKAGLWEAAFSGEGLYQVDAANFQVDDVLSNRLAVDNSVVTVTPEGAAEGNIGFAFKALETEYSPMQGSVGDLAAFATASVGAGEWSGRGTIMAAKAARTTSADGTARQLGAAGAGKSVYASLHVFAASVADTLDVVIASDSQADFLGTPQTNITFAQVTAVGAQFLSAAGPITDDWWRVEWTIAGVTPSFTFAVLIGIR